MKLLRMMFKCEGLDPVIGYSWVNDVLCALEFTNTVIDLLFVKTQVS